MYAVLGATGNTGSAVARELLHKGAAVRAVVRDAGKARALRDLGAEVAIAQLDDREALTAALRGVSGAYTLTPPRYGEGDDMLGAMRILSDTLADAIAAARVPHVVHLSSVGAHLAAGTGPILTNHYAEGALREVAPGLTLVRAPYFMDNWSEMFASLGEGQLVTLFAPELAIDMIASADIGRIAAAQLLEGARGQQVVALEGPARYAPRDVARALERILNRDIELRYVHGEAIVAALQDAGYGPRTAALFREMSEAIERGVLEHERGDRERTLRGTLSLEDVLPRLLEATQAT